MKYLDITKSFRNNIWYFDVHSETICDWEDSTGFSNRHYSMPFFHLEEYEKDKMYEGYTMFDLLGIQL